MIYDLIIALILICAFILCLYAYYKGVEHGKLLNNNIIPKININPVATFKEYIEHKDAKKKDDEVYEGWHGKQGIMNYNPYEVEKEGE